MIVQPVLSKSPFTPKYTGAYGRRTVNGQVLLHGRDYDLGATTATYDVDSDSFHGGNWFVGRGNTCYGDNKIIDGREQWVGGSQLLFPADN